MTDSSTIDIEVEVCLKSTSVARFSDIKDRVITILERQHRGGIYKAGPITDILLADTDNLKNHVKYGRICDIVSPDYSMMEVFDVNNVNRKDENPEKKGSSILLRSVPFWQASLNVHVYQLNEDGPSSEWAGENGESGNSAEGGDVHHYTHFMLPAVEFEGIWESLVYEDSTATDANLEDISSSKPRQGGEDVCTCNCGCEACAHPSKRSKLSEDGRVKAKGRSGRAQFADDDHKASGVSPAGMKPALLQYAASALMFSDSGVDTSLISWNNVVLLHGPPGTGKTSLCKGLAQKLSIRFADRYPTTQLIEINAHSLFSRWFSESGKLVHRLFAHINEIVDDEDSLVILLIDEVESLTAARKAAANGSEPSDAVRVVNAVLTAIDAFRTKKNVFLLTTSNISEAIDVAFVDRADVKLFVGPPGAAARYDIAKSCAIELTRAGVLTLPNCPMNEKDLGDLSGILVDADIARSFFVWLRRAFGPGKSSDTNTQKKSITEMALTLLNLGGIDETKLLSYFRQFCADPANSSLCNSYYDLLEADKSLQDEARNPLAPQNLLAALVLAQVSATTNGFSGRSLRKLPLQAHASFVRKRGSTLLEFLVALEKAARVESIARFNLSSL